MLINLRNALMTGKRLPYDAEVEYLESSGTQYVETGIIPDANTGLQLFSSSPANTNDAYIAGERNNSNNTRWVIGWSANSKWYCGYGATITSMVDGSPILTSINYLGDGLFKVGDSYSYTLPSLPYTPSYNIRLFGSAGVVATYTRAAVKIYSAKISVGNTLVRDYIPVRKGTVGYLYDRVSGKLFGNAGTGDFVLGQDVVPVEYIESHGTEYIDTDKSVDLPMHLEADINFTNPSTGSKVQTFVGGYNASLTDQRFWVTSLPQGKINCGLLTNSISTNLVPANRKVRLVVDFENGRQVATIDGVQYTSASQSTTNYWFRDWKLRIFQSFGTIVASNNTPLQAITNRIDIDIGASQALRLLPVRVGTEGAMMDVLTRRIYRNAGTGAFTYGNDLKYPIPAE